MMLLAEVVGYGAIVHVCENTDIAVTWNGRCTFNVFVPKSGMYDNVDCFTVSDPPKNTEEARQKVLAWLDSI